MNARNVMVPHGYDKPGSTARGKCWGQYHRAYEYSCGGTEALYDKLSARIVAQKVYLLRLRDGSVTVLEVPKFPGSWQKIHVDATQERWPDALKATIEKVEADLAFDEVTCKMLREKIYTWTPA